MLRSLHPTSGDLAGTLTPPFTRVPHHGRNPGRPSTAIERLVARLLGAHAPAIVALPLMWLRRSRYRNELANLGETQLRDVGLDPELVRRERDKPFWIA